MKIESNILLFRKTEKPDGTSKAIGNRLRTLRNITGHSRRSLTERYQMILSASDDVWRSWETGKYTGFPAKRAEDVIQVFKQEGISITREWLLFGTGDTPCPLNNTKTEEKITPRIIKNTKKTENQKINQEIEAFYEENSDAIHFIVTDKNMLPQYMPGDIVAGIKVFGKQIKNLAGLDCIVEIPGEKEPLLRTLFPDETKGFYTLIPINLKNIEPKNIITKTPLISAAPVIWLRRQHPIASKKTKN